MKLQEIATQSQTSKAMFKIWSQRLRQTKATHLERFKNLLIAHGTVVNEGDFMSVFQSLEKEGIGVLTLEQFIWKKDLRQIAVEALGLPRILSERRYKQKQKLEIPPNLSSEEIEQLTALAKKLSIKKS